MVTPEPKLPLHELTAIARDVVGRHDHEVVGAVPAEGDSGYAEVIVALNADPGSAINRLTIGVHRTASPESIREQIERLLRAGVEDARLIV